MPDDRGSSPGSGSPDYSGTDAFAMLCGCGKAARRLVDGEYEYYCDCGECPQTLPILGTKLTYNRLCVPGLNDGTSPGERVNLTSDELFGSEGSGESSASSAPSGSQE